MTEPPAETAPPPPPPEADETPYRCPRCGSPHDPFQEYCLECGARLVGPPAYSSVFTREAWTRDSPLWFWVTFLALLLIALVAGAIVLAATRGDETRTGTRQAEPTPATSLIQPPAVAPTTTPTAFPTTLTVPTTTPTIPTFPGTTTTTAPTTTTVTGTTTTTTTPTTTGGSRTVIAWPSGRSGYTVILDSIPQSRGRAAAEARAREAIADGLPQVGVLNSSLYSSLNRGYWVVFTGVYDTEAQAVAAVPNARAKGWPVAYPREIEP